MHSVLVKLVVGYNSIQHCARYSVPGIISNISITTTCLSRKEPNKADFCV